MDILPILAKAGVGFIPGIGWSVPDHAGAKAIGPGIRHDGMEIITRNDNASWLVKDAGTEVDTTENLAMTPAVGTGSLVRLDRSIDIKLAIDFTLADAAVLFTVPVGFKIQLLRTFWEPIVSFTGGASSAIGLSSSNANFNTKGDLLGGAGGDLAATLVSTGNPYKGGTLGTKYGTNGMIVLVAGDTVRFDRVVSVYTAGSGFAHLTAQIIS